MIAFNFLYSSYLEYWAISIFQTINTYIYIDIYANWLFKLDMATGLRERNLWIQTC